MIRARNTAARHENKIHDDAVALAYGFRGGLVPGVTVHGYLASEVVRRLGVEWLERGSMAVRFQAPFYEGESVSFQVDETEAGLRVEALAEGVLRATGIASMGEVLVPWDPALEVEGAVAPPLDSRPEAAAELLIPGEQIGAVLDRLQLGDAGYLEDHCFDAVAEPSELFRTTAHPTVMLAMANEILIRNYRLGPWIHVSSDISNFGTATDGDTITVQGRIADRFDKKGHEFVRLDLAMMSGSRRLMRVRHTAIYKPAREA